jgi:hypothetical protein
MRYFERVNSRSSQYYMLDFVVREEGKVTSYPVCTLEGHRICFHDGAESGTKKEAVALFSQEMLEEAKRLVKEGADKVLLDWPQRVTFKQVWDRFGEKPQWVRPERDSLQRVMSRLLLHHEIPRAEEISRLEVRGLGEEFTVLVWHDLWHGDWSYAISPLMRGSCSTEEAAKEAAVLQLRTMLLSMRHSLKGLTRS